MKRFEPARLIVFEGGDFAWLGIGERFLAWGDQVVLGSYGIELPEEHQFGIPMSEIRYAERAPGRVALTILGEACSKANS
ncbi:MAG: hypothetical protein Q8P46_18260, partial [Hyphomicrobiales bacterium]|nr:hypothetical protein [Hyphomicrobiales bacterium]